MWKTLQREVIQCHFFAVNSEQSKECITLFNIQDLLLATAYMTRQTYRGKIHQKLLAMTDTWDLGGQKQYASGYRLSDTEGVEEENSVGRLTLYSAGDNLVAHCVNCWTRCTLGPIQESHSFVLRYSF